MRIALINNLYPPYIVGGNEMLAKDVVEELQKRGHEIHVITGRGHDFAQHAWFYPVLDLDLDRKGESFLGQKKATYIDLVKWHLFNPKSYHAVRRTLKTIRPDLVVIWNLYLASVAPLIAATRLKLPTVIQVCDRWLIYSLKDLSSLLKPAFPHDRFATMLLRKIAQPVLCHLASPRDIIAISHFIRDQYIAAGFPGSMIEVIHLGVPTDLFGFKPPSKGSTWVGRIGLLYVGSLWEGKGLQVALRALSILTQDMHAKNVYLDIYGEGTDSFKDYLREIVRAENIEQYVTFHGFVTRETIKDAYKSHDILVFPSVWGEPFAAVPLEAMSCGLAIVATSAGGTPEAIIDGETGLVVSPNNPDELASALKHLIDDDDLRAQLGQSAARAAREHFDFRLYVNQLEAHYTERVTPGGSLRL